MKNFKLLRGEKKTRQRIGEPVPIQYEPMQTYRYLVTFPESFNISPYLVRNFTTPSGRFDVNRLTWYDIEFKLYEPIQPQLSQNIFELMRSDVINNRSTFLVELLGPTGIVAIKYQITGHITQIDYDLVYPDPDDTEINIRISVDTLISL